MKKDNYVKAVYSVFFVGLVIMTITVFILLKYMNVTNFFDNLDSFYSFFMIGFLIAFCLTKLLEWPLRNERGGKVFFIFYVITTIGQYVFIGALIGGVVLMSKGMGLINIEINATITTTVIFGVLTLSGLKGDSKPKEYPIINNIFVSTVAVLIVNLFLKSNLVSIIVDIVLIIVLSIFIHEDAIKIKNRIINFKGNTIMKYTYIFHDASNLIFDFILLWLSIEDLMVRGQNKDD